MSGTTRQVAGDSTAAHAAAPSSARRGPREGAILLLFVLATLGATTYVMLGEEQDAKDDPAQQAARGEISGLDALSLLQADNLQRVLDEVEDGERPLVTSLRVAATRVDVNVRDEEGTRKILSFDPSFDHEESDFGVGEDEFVRPEQIDTRAPERIVRSVTKRTGQPADAVDYLVRSASRDRSSAWTLFLDEGPAGERQWSAAADGSDVRKLGEPAGSGR